ncbi:MAG: flagellar basal body P-ring protein FlgI [Proteobacteria bacterium]|nr:flagellar basal body P-ring protein FlgI [Pseudomonadota bacterium]NBY20958.1 flagellar basal body P-ring protein FlgI [bacterium]
MKYLLFFILCSSVSFGARIKDIAMLKGARNNQLFGYGLVVGLPGTGDKANELTENSMGLILKGLGIDTKSQKLDTKNAAIVVVSSTLPPFSKVGQQLDVSLASIGTAASLDQGTLMMTPLKGPDGKIYAMAQGKAIVMKKEARGGGASGGAAANMVSATIPNGAMLEKEIGWDVSQEKQLKYVINNPDFTTAVRMAKKINDELGGKYAVANDASTVEVMYPYTLEANPIELIAQIESLEVEADRKAKVIINSKTGTVILGDQVRISPVAIAHGNLKLEIKNPPADQGRNISSTNSQGAQAPTPAAGEGEGEQAKKVMLVSAGPSISEVVSALNDTGAGAEDLIAILQALKSSGALLADLEMQ